MGLDAPAVRTIEIDLEQIEKVREKMPIIEQRRRDLYSLSLSTHRLLPLDEQIDEKISWGQIKITSNQIFFRTPLTIGLVNKKPVVPGREFERRRKF